MVDKTKKCNKCKEVKNISEFHKDKNRFDGLMRYCKVCSKERKRLYYQKKLQENPNYNKDVYTKRVLRNPNYKKERYEHDLMQNPDLNAETWQRRVAKNPDIGKERYEKRRESDIEYSKNYKKGVKSCKKNTKN